MITPRAAGSSHPVTAPNYAAPFPGEFTPMRIDPPEPVQQELQLQSPSAAAAAAPLQQLQLQSPSKQPPDCSPVSPANPQALGQQQQQQQQQQRRVGHGRSSSLQVPEPMSARQRGGPPSSAGGSGGSPAEILTPGGTRIHRPSITSLLPTTVHNRLVVPAPGGGGGGGGPSSPGGSRRPSVVGDGKAVMSAGVALPLNPGASSLYGRRMSALSPVALNAVASEHRAELDALMTVAEFSQTLSLSRCFLFFVVCLCCS